MSNVPALGDASRVGSEIDAHLLDGVTYRIPFDDQSNSARGESRLWTMIASDHVVSAAGTTGLVHIAPALGQDDFKVSSHFQLSILGHCGVVRKPAALQARCREFEYRVVDSSSVSSSVFLLNL